MNDKLGNIVAGLIVIGVPIGIIVGVVALITITIKLIWNA